MIRSLMITLFYLMGISAGAQILNVESLRKVADTSGWSGTANVNFSIVRNTSDLFSISSDIHVQYKMNRHLFLIKNNLKFLKIEDDKFSNSGVSHLRYNYRFLERIAWEFFVQGQYNKVSKIDFRGLVGTGPRFKLTNSEKYKIYLGTLIMFEQEELSDGSKIKRNFRNSTYLSFSLYPTDRISIVSTTYFQPRLNELSDFRLSSQSTLAINLFKNIDFTIEHEFTFDKNPALGIPKSQYSFMSGLAYSFD